MTETCGTQLEGYFREDAEILLKNQTRGQKPPVHVGNRSHVKSPSQWLLKGKCRDAEFYIQHKEKCKFFTKEVIQTFFG